MRSAVPATLRQLGDGQRRYLTVMFCDLVGSTDLAGELDPEELRSIVLSYQEAAAQAIEQYGGYIANYMGDGVLAYFGYPIADQQAGQHAVRAGLELLDLIERRRSDFPALEVRVGVHAGITVVADMGAGARRKTHDIVGETPNVAARIQSVAAPGTVCVSHQVATTCSDEFEFESLGAHELKGVREPLELHRAIAVSGSGDRLDAAAARHGLTPLVGREHELARLHDAWRRTLAGDAQVAWIVGEPGLGKTRLVRELVRQVRGDGGIEIEFRCSSLHQSSSLYASTEQFRRFMLSTIGEVSIAGAERLADENGTPRGLAVPVVADLLGIALVSPYQPVTGSADYVRKHTLEVVGRLVDDRARRQPVLVVIDDMQWIDSTSLELASGHVGHQRDDRVMTVVTHRSDPPPNIPDFEHHQVITLEPLSEADVREIITHVVAHDADDTLIAAISARTEGVPLFAEELAHLIGQTGDENAATIPATLRDSLMARVDRLGPEVDIVRTLAVLGREASITLLREVSDVGPETFETGLEVLLERRMLIRRGSGPHAAIAFRHGLLEEVVYESLLHSTRRTIHERSAAAIENKHADRSATEPEVAARHLELSGQFERAIAYLLRAGDRSIAISAHDEALVHLHHALELLRELPEGVERDLLEIDIQVKIGVPLTARFGYASEAASGAYSRAQELCERVDGAAPVYAPMYGLFRTRLLGGDYRTARQLADQLSELALAEPTRVAWSVGAGRAAGSVAFYRGDDQRLTVEAFEPVLRAADADKPGAYLADLNDVVDPVITSRSYTAWATWLLGEPKLARAASAQSLMAARRLEHPFTLGLALSFDAWLLQFDGDIEATIDRSSEALEHARAHDFPFWIGWAEVLLAWARARGGDPNGPQAMRDGIERWQAQGSRLGISYFSSLVADGELHLGDLEGARTTLDRSIAVAEEMGERFWLPEMLRLRAEVDRQARPGAGTELLARAGALAESQHALGLLRRIRS